MKRILLPTALTVTMAMPSIASAQQYNKPWTFGQQNRAQLAVVMSQMEGNGSASSGTSSASGSAGTTIVCGGGSSTAQANNTCIILNNSNGQISTDQVSDGDQSSLNETNSTTHEASDVDEVLSALNGSN
jgi:hypothetical protein